MHLVRARRGGGVVRAFVKASVGILIMVLGTALGGRLYYAQLINGPDLIAPSSVTSLKSEFPPPVGWSEALVESARQYADSLASSAVIVLVDGHIVAEWGATDQRSSLHSVRKSLVSALYGIAVDRGLIDINRTLAELEIDDIEPRLSDVERSARLVDLLTARSGIYHPSIQDDDGPYPERGAHHPDEAFVYNNWSFNAVGGIFERLTGLSMGEAFKAWIADSIGMQDFRPEIARGITRRSRPLQEQARLGALRQQRRRPVWRRAGAHQRQWPCRSWFRGCVGDTA